MRSVGELVKERLGRAKIFERFGIDYFCGGKESLRLSCVSSGVDLVAVVQELQDEEASGTKLAQMDWSKRAIFQLVDHIDESHNQFLKTELPRLLTVIDGLRKSYARSHPELFEIRDIFRNLTIELGIHVLNDERLLFPLCRAVGRAGAAPLKRTDPKNLVSVIQAGNESTAEAMKKIRDLTNHYAFPNDVGNSYKFMLQALRGLEADLHLHIHEENNVLFPLLLTEDFSPASNDSPPDQNSWM